MTPLALNEASTKWSRNKGSDLEVSSFKG